MTNNQLQYINVRAFRTTLRDILDATCFMGHTYIVTNHGEPVGQVLPPRQDPDDRDADHLTVTELRLNTKQVFDDVHHDEKTFLVFRYGRPVATICAVRWPLERQVQQEGISTDGERQKRVVEI